MQFLYQQNYDCGSVTYVWIYVTDSVHAWQTPFLYKHKEAKFALSLKSKDTIRSVQQQILIPSNKPGETANNTLYCCTNAALS